MAPVAAGSSFGVRLVGTEEELEPALRAALVLDDRVLVEQVVVGREVDVAVLDDPDGGRRVGPPLEILVNDGLFDTATKYDGSAAFVIPAQLTETEAEALTDSALRVYDALGCRGIARVDFPEPGRAGAQRGQHDAGDDRRVPGAQDVRRRRADLPGVPGPAHPVGVGGRQVSVSSGRIVGLDVLRGIAILLVMLRHAFPDTFPGAGVVGFGSVGW